MVVECEEGNRVESGDRFGGVRCGMVVSKISDRSKVENVRFASSANNWSVDWLNNLFSSLAYSSGNEARHVVSASFVSKVLPVNHHHEAS